MKASIILLIITVLLITAFFVQLPELRSCVLPRPGDERERMAAKSGRGERRKKRGERRRDARDGAELLQRARRRRAETAAVLAITLVYAVAAFHALGDRRAPQSSHTFGEGESVVLDLGQTREISRAMVYTMLGRGSFSVELSDDGQSWGEPREYEKNHIAVLKWHDIELSESARYLRLTAHGDPELGELALYGADGQSLSYTGDAALCDEPQLVPDKPSFLNSSYFDEIYHARTALEHLRGDRPYEISHPPLGKLIIAAGISLFGMTPFGWRFSGVLFGVLMLPLVYAFARRLFGRGSVALCCMILTAADFMHLVQTRIATIDTYAVFFILLMYYFMYRWLFPDAPPGARRAEEGRVRDLALSGLFFGIGAACKWTCLYAGAGLGVIWALHWAGRFVRGGRETLRPFGKNVLLCLGFFVAVPALVYYVSYWPYGTAKGMSGIGMLFNADYARTVLENQKYMFSYHSGVNATHPYSSRWYQWMLDIRPILYYLEYDGARRSSFGAFLNPVLCWAGLISLVPMGVCGVMRRDRRALFLLLGYLAQLVPWVFIGRVTFEYHYFPCSVFLALSLGYTFALLRENTKRSRVWNFTLVGYSAALLALYYPVLTGIWVTAKKASAALRWLPTWPF